MKKVSLLSVMMIALCASYATIVEHYNFAALTGTYTPVTGTTITVRNNTVNTYPAPGTIYEFAPRITWVIDLDALSMGGNPTPVVGIQSM